MKFLNPSLVQFAIPRVFSIVVALFLMSGNIVSQEPVKKDTKNVHDYYKMLSQEFEQVKAAKTEKLTVRDLNNGYLQFDSDYYQKQVVLFRKVNRKALILVGVTTGGIASTDLFAFEYCDSCSDRKMSDVTAEVIPRLSARQNRDLMSAKNGSNIQAEYAAIAYDLPRNGRVIKVLGSNEQKQDVEIYRLKFMKDHFVIDR